MSLPDYSRLLSLSKGEWRLLGLRLAELGIDSAYVTPLNRVGARLSTSLRAPLRKWHVRRMSGPAASALRLLTFGDRVAIADARVALGEPLLANLIKAGIIEGEDSGLFSPFYVKPVLNRLYILCDDLAHRGNAVMGVGDTTGALCQAASPIRALRRVLDLGCGAGTIALSLSHRAKEIVGTDINPRAITFAQINAAINGIDNVQFLEGDKFSPVAGRQFDLIVSHLPFACLPENVEFASYLHGGTHGDELTLQLLAEIKDHLSATGRAIFLTTWPNRDELQSDIREALGCDDLNLLMLRHETTDADEISALYALAEHFERTACFEKTTLQWRDHLERLGISGARLTYNVIERAAAGNRGWTATLDIPPNYRGGLTSQQIERILAAQNLLAAGAEAIAAAKLRIPSGVIFAEEHSPDSLNSRTRVCFPADSIWRSTAINAESRQILKIIHKADSVYEAAMQFADCKNIRTYEVIDPIIKAIEQALRLGIVDPV